MAQNTTGLHAVLSSATIYRLFQGLLGGHATRTAFARDEIRPFPGIRVLDIGCGPADVLDYLPATVHYWGFDISERYIARARARHGNRGRFLAKEFEPADVANLPPMDVAIATGLFHHLDDATAGKLLATIRAALKPGGRLLALDGVFEPGQNPVARWLIARDRGQHVRTRPQYEALYARAFPAPRVRIHHRAWLPYTYCLAECIRPSP